MWYRRALVLSTCFCEILPAAVFVELMKGYHDLTSTLSFHKPLGGTVVVRAYQGQEVHVVSVPPLVYIFPLSLSSIPCPVLPSFLTVPGSFPILYLSYLTPQCPCHVMPSPNCFAVSWFALVRLILPCPVFPWP